MSKTKDLFKKTVMKKVVILVIMLMFLFAFTGCTGTVVEDKEMVVIEDSTAKPIPNEAKEQEAAKEEVPDIAEFPENDPFDGFKLIEVDGGNKSGHREPNVVVNIGFGEREYYAYTNEHGQLVKVTAKEITLQDDEKEPVLSNGRYYSDQAKVPGVENPTLDKGHVIADSLGGVSNAYNITPQDSTLNRHGDQAYMERTIRSAGGCTDFTALITYPDTNTQIPIRYIFTYTINGDIINDAFDNVNPDGVNEALGITAPIMESEEVPTIISTGLVITELDKKEEYIVIKNSNANAVNIAGWKIVSVRGNQSFTFPIFSLESNASVKVGDSVKNKDVDFHWLDGNGTWNNSKSDPAELYNNQGTLVDRYDD